MTEYEITRFRAQYANTRKACDGRCRPHHMVVRSNLGHLYHPSCWERQALSGTEEH